MTMVEFVETSLFSKVLNHYLSDEEYATLQFHLLLRPESGDLIRGTGGVRKLRWASRGRGKRGGIRVIYYLKLQDGRIWLLTLYGKESKDSIPAHVLKRLREEIDDG